MLQGKGRCEIQMQVYPDVSCIVFSQYDDIHTGVIKKIHLNNIKSYSWEQTGKQFSFFMSSILLSLSPATVYFSELTRISCLRIFLHTAVPILGWSDARKSALVSSVGFHKWFSLLTSQGFAQKTSRGSTQTAHKHDPKYLKQLHLGSWCI